MGKIKNLIDIFRNKPKSSRPGLSKEEVVKLLKTTPEALQAFEESYQMHAFQDTTGLFDTGIREQKENAEKMVVPYGKWADIINDIVERIVYELLEGTHVFHCNSHDFHAEHIVPFPNRLMKPVTQDEINRLPKELRPQLTGTYMQIQVNPNSSNYVLYDYKQYLEADSEKKKKLWYQQFQWGLDVLDLDPLMYEILGMNRNSMGNWLPVLAKAVMKQKFFEMPETTLIKVPIPLLQLSRLDYESLTWTTLRIVDVYCQKVFELDVNREYFVKTGVFSSKFDFRNAHVYGEKEVRELGEYLLFIQSQSCIMSGGLTSTSFYGVNTTNEWAVREYIKDTEENPCIYKGMPLHTEYRVFIDCDQKTVLGCFPYWEPETMEKRFGQEEDADSPHNVHDYIIYKSHKEILMHRYDENKEDVIRHVTELLSHLNLTGQWSLDIMQNGKNFYVIDMALAANSAFSEKVKGLNAIKEEWIPEFSKE